MIIGDYFVHVEHARFAESVPLIPDVDEEHTPWIKASTHVRVFDKAEFEAMDKNVAELLEKGTLVAEGTAMCSDWDQFCKRRGLLIAGGRAFKTLGKHFTFVKGNWVNPEGRYVVSPRKAKARG